MDPPRSLSGPHSGWTVATGWARPLVLPFLIALPLLAVVVPSPQGPWGGFSFRIGLYAVGAALGFAAIHRGHARLTFQDRRFLIQRVLRRTVVRREALDQVELRHTIVGDARWPRARHIVEVRGQLREPGSGDPPSRTVQSLLVVRARSWSSEDEKALDELRTRLAQEDLRPAVELITAPPTRALVPKLPTRDTRLDRLTPGARAALETTPAAEWGYRFSPYGATPHAGSALARLGIGCALVGLWALVPIEDSHGVLRLLGLGLLVPALVIVMTLPLRAAPPALANAGLYLLEHAIVLVRRQAPAIEIPASSIVGLSVQTVPGPALLANVHVLYYRVNGYELRLQLDGFYEAKELIGQRVTNWLRAVRPDVPVTTG